VYLNKETLDMVTYDLSKDNNMIIYGIYISLGREKDGGSVE
jgi:hypothetical protein